MDNIKAGVVVINRFCGSGSDEFKSYIDYIDREEAKRNDHLSEYNLYNDYMGNPDKTTGLFTDAKEKLSMNEKATLKQCFETAQKNESLMWQTVISFDNRWLAKYGLYDLDKRVLDERKIKELATGAVNTMLKNENMEHSVWSAAIHYNTDNIHIHIATVEPTPMRQMKSYKQYKYEINNNGEYIKGSNGEYVKANGRNEVDKWGNPYPKYDRLPILDSQGNQVEKEEYVGRFKERSLQLCKKYMVDNILEQQKENILINQVMREQILKSKERVSFIKDPELKDKFLEIHGKLPRKGKRPRGLWNYNNSIMTGLRPELNELTDTYLKKYQPDEYKQMRLILAQQSALYTEAYGQRDNTFEDNKIKELYTRMGNAILKELKDFDKASEKQLSDNQVQVDKRFDLNVENSITEKKKDHAFVESIVDNNYDNINEEAPDPEKYENINVDNYDPGDLKYYGNKKNYMKWSDDYRQAKSLMFDENPKYATAISLLREEARQGNVLAVYDLGDIYRFGRGVDIDMIAAKSYYTQAFKMFNEIYNNKEYTKMQSYLEYRIGKCYDMGLGTQQDYNSAIKWYELSGNRFANYSLGNLYYYGYDNNKDIEKARIYFEKAESDPRGNIYAAYKLGEIYSSGAYKNEEKANKFYEKALDGFLRTYQRPEKRNDNLTYRIGTMYLRGKGIEIDVKEAERFFKESAAAGNPLAQYELAKIYLQNEDIESIKKAESLLSKSAGKGENVLAQCMLGRLYTSDLKEIKDINKAIYWLDMADRKGNDYAAYLLGKIYDNPEYDINNQDKALEYYKKSAERNNKNACYILGEKLLETSDINKMKRGIEWLEKSADLGNDYAAYKLGNIYGEKGKIYNPEKAIEWLDKAAQEGNVLAQYKLGILYLKGEIVDKDINIAEKYLKMVIDQAESSQSKEEAKGFNQDIIERQSGLAYYTLAQAYEEDLNIDENDQKKANDYYMKAFDLFMKLEKRSPDKYLEYRIGSMLYEGKGVDQDQELGKEYIEKAARAGNKFAQYKVAKIYLASDNVEDKRKAEQWLLKCASDNILAQYALGKLYISDLDEFKDIDKALYWFNMADNRGNDLAAYSLGKIYSDEKYGIKDDCKAIEFYEKARAAGNSYATYGAAKLYADKESEVYDPVKALAYLAELADTGNQFAQFKLGMIYLQGDIIPRNIEKAKEYFTAASNNGNEYAKKMLDNMNKRRINWFSVLHTLSGRRIAFELDRAISALKRSMDNTNEKYMNEIIHEQIEREEIIR